MILVPKALALTLCERLVVDPAAGQVSFVGVFFYRPLVTMPQRFTVCTVLYDGFGEGTMELRVFAVGQRRPIYRLRRWTKFGERFRTILWEFSIAKARFPRRGRYRFRLSFDKRRIADSYLILT